MHHAAQLIAHKHAETSVECILSSIPNTALQMVKYLLLLPLQYHYITLVKCSVHQHLDLRKI